MRNKTFDNARSRAAKFVALTLVVATLAFLTFAFNACGEKTPPKPQAQLIFSDEFDSDSVDLEKWIVHGADPADGNPGEVRRGGWWTEDSVFSENGNLVIRTTYDDENNTFYTGCVDAKKQMAYGFYEAKCKVPEANGMWAAFWIMCEKMGLEDPDTSVGGAEIDIFESPFYNLNVASVQHAIHSGGYGNNAQSATSLPLPLTVEEGKENGYQSWHTFALDWQPDAYTFYIDGVETYKTSHPYGGRENNVSSVPSYIMLSVEVGGSDGKPGKSPFIGNMHPVTNNKKYYDMSAFSVDFLIDYVRVWDINPYV